MSGVSRRTQDSVPGRAGFSNKRDLAAVSGTTHRDHGRTSRPDKWSGHGTLQRLLGEVLLFRVCPLREEDLLGLQGSSYGHSATRDRAYQQPGEDCTR